MGGMLWHRFRSCWVNNYSVDETHMTLGVVSRMDCSMEQ
jgi:hypothetical protein